MYFMFSSCICLDKLFSKVEGWHWLRWGYLTDRLARVSGWSVDNRPTGCSVQQKHWCRLTENATWACCDHQLCKTEMLHIEALYTDLDQGNSAMLTYISDFISMWKTALQGFSSAFPYLSNGYGKHDVFQQKCYMVWYGDLLKWLSLGETTSLRLPEQPGRSWH